MEENPPSAPLPPAPGAPAPLPPVRQTAPRPLAKAVAPPPLPPGVRRMPAPPRAPAKAPMVGTDPDMDKGLAVQMPGLTQSAQAYLRASQLESKVADQMRRVEERVAMHKLPLSVRETPVEIRQAIGLLRSRPSQRAAILASVILGPPRAFDP
jgi:hypothetical protein